ncbi:hypothetical protein HK097_005694 [Rhizophlyctis rosea]|uniref:Uncharacterized protein n=1 Tax=Rhizophlyctis rosea TaxID=64517 RepID=A0AAD5SFB3_9FUNG|nr:hypothetical protein HK097_005694 [Rhizophlyctis rosea]
MTEKTYPPLSDIPTHLRPEDVKLIACDIDGTTLTSSHVISPYTLETFRKVRHQRPDINILFATGRPRIATVAIREAMRELGHAVGIYLNGALCGREDVEGQLKGGEDAKSSLDFHVLHETPLKPKDAVWYVQWAVRNQRCVVLYSYDTTITPFDHPSCELVQGASEPYPVEIPESDLIPQILSNTLKVHKMIFLGPKVPLDQTRTDLDSESTRPTSTSFLRNNNFSLEVVSKHTSKAAALKFFTDNLAGCRLDNVIAFGDGDNDVEMIKECGLGVGMGNGLAHVKKVAKYVAPTNDEDGVARVLRGVLGL